MLPKSIDELMEHLQSEKEKEYLAFKLVQVYFHERWLEKNSMEKVVAI